MPVETPEAPVVEQQQQPTGVNRFLQQFEGIDSPETAPEPPKAEQPAPQKEAKPEPTPKRDPEMRITSKPPERPIEKKDKADGPPELRKRLDELKAKDGEWEKKWKARDEEFTKLTKERDDYKGRRVWTDEDGNTLKKHQDESAALRKQLAEADYSRSDEFKTRFKDPYTNLLKTAAASVAHYPVATNEEGGTRAGTQQDFERIMRADPTERGAIAQKLFGVNAGAVMSDIREIERMQIAAQQAISDASTRSEERAKTERAQMEASQKEYDAAFSQARADLEAKFPRFFAKSEDPEVQKAMDAGNQWMESIVGEAPKMTPGDRAAANAVFQYRAGAGFARQVAENAAKDKKIATLEAEVKKLRGSDPGRTTDKPGGGEPQKDDKPVGIAGLGAKFDAL